MGKIIVTIFQNGRDIKEQPSGLYSSLSHKYNIPGIEKLEHEVEDFNIEIQLNGDSKEIDWTTVSYLNNEMKEQVDEVIYLRSVFNSLKDVVSEISKCSFENKERLERLGQQSIEIIGNMRVTSNVTIEHSKGNAIKRISQTLGEEVSTLNSVKYNASNSVKNDALKHASNQLQTDILGFSSLISE